MARFINRHFDSQPTHIKPMKAVKNKGLSALLHAMGRSVGVKTPIHFKFVN